MISSSLNPKINRLPIDLELKKTEQAISTWLKQKIPLNNQQTRTRTIKI